MIHFLLSKLYFGVLRIYVRMHLETTRGFAVGPFLGVKVDPSGTSKAPLRQN